MAECYHKLCTWSLTAHSLFARKWLHGDQQFVGVVILWSLFLALMVRKVEFALRDLHVIYWFSSSQSMVLGRKVHVLICVFMEIKPDALPFCRASKGVGSNHRITKLVSKCGDVFQSQNSRVPTSNYQCYSQTCFTSSSLGSQCHLYIHGNRKLGRYKVQDFQRVWLASSGANRGNGFPS